MANSWGSKTSINKSKNKSSSSRFNPVKYAINVTKSAKFIGIATLRGIDPKLTNIVTSTATYAKSAIEGSKEFVTSLMGSNIARDTIGLGKQTAKNFLSDIKTGQWYNTSRAEKSNEKLAKSFGMDIDFDLDLDFSDENNPFLNDDEDSNVTNNSLNSVGKNIASATITSNIRSSEYVANVSKSNTQALLSQNAKIMGTVNNTLMLINSSILGLHKDLASGLNSHIQNSTSFYNTSLEQLAMQTNYLEHIDAMMTEIYMPTKQSKQKSAWSKIAGSGDVIPNLGEWGKLAFNRAKNETSLGFVIDAINMYKDNFELISQMDMFQNPVAALATTLLTAGAKKKYGKSLSKYTSGIENWIGGAMGRIHKYNKNPYTNGLGATLASLLDIFPEYRSIFDSDTASGYGRYGRRNTARTDRYSKGAKAFDGKDSRALQIVIPQLLSKILANVEGVSKELGVEPTEAKFYDYERGQFRTESKLFKEYDNFGDAHIRSVEKSMGRWTSGVVAELDKTSAGLVDYSSISNAFTKLMVIASAHKFDIGIYKNANQCFNELHHQHIIGPGTLITDPDEIKTIKKILKLMYRSGNALSGKATQIQAEAIEASNEYMSNVSNLSGWQYINNDEETNDWSEHHTMNKKERREREKARSKAINDPKSDTSGNFLDKGYDWIKKIMAGDRYQEFIRNGGLFGAIDSLPDRIAEKFEIVKGKIKEWWDNSDLKTKWEDTKSHIGETLKGWGHSVSDYASDIYGRVKDGFGNVSNRAARGGNVVKSGMISVSEGEYIVPSERNPFYNGRTNKAAQKANEKRIANKYLASGGTNYWGSYDEGGTVLPDGVTIDVNGRYRYHGKFISKAKIEELSKAQEPKKEGIVHQIVHDIDSKLFGSDDAKEKKKYLTEKLKDFDLGNGVVGAVIGGAVTGSPLGLIGGLAVGGAIGIIKKNQDLQEKLFGTFDGEEYSGGIIPKSITNFAKKKFPDMAKGGALGSIVSLATGSPFGIVGGFAIGAGLSLVSKTNKFNEIIFGHEDLNGKRKGGLIGIIQHRIIDPLVNFVEDTIHGLKDWFKDKIMAPFGKLAKAMKDWVFGRVKAFGKRAGQKVLKGAKKVGFGLLGKIDALTGVTSGATLGFAKGAIGLGKKVVGLPFTLAGKAGNALERHNIRDGYSSLTPEERMAVMEGEDWKNSSMQQYNEFAQNASEEDLALAELYAGGKRSAQDAINKDQRSMLLTLQASMDKQGAGHYGELHRLKKLMNSKKARNGDFSDVFEYTKELKKNGLISDEYSEDTMRKYFIDNAEKRRSIVASVSGDYDKNREEFMKKHGLSELGQAQLNQIGVDRAALQKKGLAASKSDAAKTAEKLGVTEGEGHKINLMENMNSNLETIAASLKGGNAPASSGVITTSNGDQYINADGDLMKVKATASGGIELDTTDRETKTEHEQKEAIEENQLKDSREATASLTGEDGEKKQSFLSKLLSGIGSVGSTLLSGIASVGSTILSGIGAAIGIKAIKSLLTGIASSSAGTASDPNMRNDISSEVAKAEYEDKSTLGKMAQGLDTIQNKVTGKNMLAYSSSDYVSKTASSRIGTRLAKNIAFGQSGLIGKAVAKTVTKNPLGKLASKAAKSTGKIATKRVNKLGTGVSKAVSTTAKKATSKLAPIISKFLTFAKKVPIVKNLLKNVDPDDAAKGIAKGLGTKLGANSSFTKILGKVATFAQIATIAYHGIDALQDARAMTILGIVEKPNVGQRLVAALAEVLNYAIPGIGGLIPTETILNVLMSVLTTFGLFNSNEWSTTEQRKQAQEVLEDYRNKTNNPGATLEEYIHNELGLYTVGEKVGSWAKGLFKKSDSTGTTTTTSNNRKDSSYGSGSGLVAYTGSGSGVPYYNFTGGASSSSSGDIATDVTSYVSSKLTPSKSVDLNKLIDNLWKYALSSNSMSDYDSAVSQYMRSNQLTSETSESSNNMMVSLTSTLMRYVVSFTRPFMLLSEKMKDMGDSIAEGSGTLQDSKSTDDVEKDTTGFFEKVGNFFSNLFTGSGSGIHTSQRGNNRKYGKGTISSNGCGPAVASTVLKAYGKQSNINSAADFAEAGGYVAGASGAKGTRASYFSDILGANGISTHYTGSKSGIKNAIKSGRPTILLGQDKNNKSKSHSPFGPNPHYVVARGTDSKGNVFIDDPELGKTALYKSNILNNTKLGVMTGGDSDIPIKDTDGFVWNWLISQGFTKEATAGIMGNLYQESNITFNKAEGQSLKQDTPGKYQSNDYYNNFGINYTSQTYTDAVNKGLTEYIEGSDKDNAKPTQGIVTAYEFANMPWKVTRNGAKRWGQNGYGLCQWTTSSRKTKLYNLAKENNTGIDDPNIQMQHLYNELTGDYKNTVFTPLTKSTDINSATSIFMKKFEGAGDESLSDRQGYANTYYNYFTANPPTKTTIDYKSMKSPTVLSVEKTSASDNSSSESSSESSSSNGGILDGLSNIFSSAINSIMNSDKLGSSAKGLLKWIFGSSDSSSSDDSSGNSSGSSGETKYLDSELSKSTIQKMTTQEKAITGEMINLVGKLNYGQGNDKYPLSRTDFRDGGSADCSSTVAHCLNTGIPGVISAVTDTDGIWSSGRLVDKADTQPVSSKSGKGKGSGPHLDKLRPGDAMLYKHSDSKKTGHVEMYLGDGKRAGHGGGVGPKITNYDADSDRYIGAKRFVTDYNNNMEGTLGGASGIPIYDFSSASSNKRYYKYSGSASNVSTTDTTALLNKIMDLITAIAKNTTYNQTLPSLLEVVAKYGAIISQMNSNNTSSELQNSISSQLNSAMSELESLATSL